MLRTDSERAGQQAVVIIQVGKDKGRQSGSGQGRWRDSDTFWPQSQ